ncbi:MAG TPA: class I poly(R)-hydroxyalkanoic acid synthase [Alphaproteobacteria bacterium]|nr:class I poly(R)-hydroxyalkanoic acid synthase [Alphaproteobacteria bacterium]HAJ47634.1 class I poly(R)-hydroxyalkanoic acid synthase [Alphaproteobacteria bacterium]
MVKVAAQSQRLVTDFMKGQAAQAKGGAADPLNLTGTFLEFLSHAMRDPTAIWQAQFKLWQGYMELWQNTALRLMGEQVGPVIEPPAGDKRFKDKEWTENQVFDFIKQSYLLSARWLQNTVGEVKGLDEKTRKKVDFYTKQFADAMSPTNFVMTNPEVLRATLTSNGENLVKGLDNLLHDLERGKGQLSIRQTDMEYFEVGRNIATTPGKIVFRNDLLELLQYSPTTDEQYEIPLLIFPPWINKFYILDLQPTNSFVKWATAKGYTVFVASWVNPDARLAQKTFEDYMREGIFEGLDAVEKATGSRKVNTIGYCIGGTLLSATLAYMASKGDDRVNSATFFAAQTDFSEAGDLQVFIDDEQLQSMEEMMKASGGYLDGSKMATTFNMLRSNDLIWSFVVNNYLLGKDPMRFDLLYWNADATRMPINMHMFYLRECYRQNNLATGRMVLGGVKLDLSKVTVPVFLQSSKEDHIAPYRSVYKSTKLFKGPVTFMMAGSGHIAGVINHPDAKKYQHWRNEKLPESVEDWIAGAKEFPGSWWDYWDGWLSEKSGPKVKARVPGDAKLKVIEDAPGSYVKMK